MKFSVIIPARYASVRFPGKALCDIAGRPMVVRVADRAKKSGASEVLVATDHPEIAAAAARFGHDFVMTSTRHASGTERLAEVVARRRYPARHVIVNVQGDEPLIDPRLIREVAAGLVRRRAAQMSTACRRIRDAREFADPNVVKVVLDRAGFALCFSRAPVPWARDEFAHGIRRIPAGLPAYRHLGIYACRAGFLRRYARLEPVAIERFEALEQLRALAHGCRIAVVVTRRSVAPGVDTPSDLERVRAIVR